MSATAGKLIKGVANDIQDELCDGFMHLCEGHTPQNCSTAFVLAIITLIEHAVKPEHQQGAAEGIASAIIANFSGCEGQVS